VYFPTICDFFNDFYLKDFLPKKVFENSNDFFLLRKKDFRKKKKIPQIIEEEKNFSEERSETFFSKFLQEEISMTKKYSNSIKKEKV